MEPWFGEMSIGWRSLFKHVFNVNKWTHSTGSLSWKPVADTEQLSLICRELLLSSGFAGTTQWLVTVWASLLCSQPSWRITKKLEDDWNAIASFPQRKSVKLKKSPLAYVQADGHIWGLLKPFEGLKALFSAEELFWNLFVMDCPSNKTKTWQQSRYDSPVKEWITSCL